MHSPHPRLEQHVAEDVKDSSVVDGVWPRWSSIADLGRILVILHGASAPSEAMLKKWSAAGEFRSCLIAADETLGSLSGVTGEGRKSGASHAKPGRPGLQLATDKAIARVYELWPQLADSDPRAVFEQAVARTARQLAAAIRPLVFDEPATLPAALVPFAAVSAPAAGQREFAEWQLRIEAAMTSLAQDVKELRREMAQFSSLRNNLITRLDEVVARSRESLVAINRGDAGGSDPIVEARRDRDMGVLKSNLEQILSTLTRLEASRSV